MTTKITFTPDELRAFAEVLASLRRLLEFASRLSRQMSRGETWTHEQELRTLQDQCAELADELTVLSLARWNELKPSYQELDREAVRKRTKA